MRAYRKHGERRDHREASEEARPAGRWRAWLSGDDRGGVTAEFAITLPVVLLVLGVVIGGLTLASYRVGITGLAGDLARLEARGDTAQAAARLDEHTGPVALSRSTSGSLHCVTAHASPGSGLLAALSVEARSCAARSEP